MTNKEKFIEVMNQIFGAGFTMENLDDKGGCVPCMYYKIDEGVCIGECEKCQEWWDKEYVEPEPPKTGDVDD